jgi:hypothetical protein
MGCQGLSKAAPVLLDEEDVLIPPVDFVRRIKMAMKKSLHSGRLGTWSSKSSNDSRLQTRGLRANTLSYRQTRGHRQSDERVSSFFLFLFRAQD